MATSLAVDRRLCISVLLACLLAELPACQCPYRDEEGSTPTDKSVGPFWTLPSYKVNPEGELLSILVTIYASDKELGFLRNQLRTFVHFFAVGSIKDYFLVTPRAHVSKVQAFTHSMEGELGLARGLLTPVAEDKCVSEFHPRHRFMGIRDNGGAVFSGWTKQQIVKLACAKIVHTPFYLVMDADIMFVMPRAASSLFRSYQCESRSPVCDAEGTIGFQSINDAYPLFNRSEEQREWMRRTARSLQLAVPIDWRFAQGVTPQILSKDVAVQMGHWIQARFREDSWTSFLLEIILHDKVNYREEEKKAGGKRYYPPWTEFDLYWIFATHSDTWDSFHSVAKAPTLGISVWEKHEFDSWQPCSKSYNAFAKSGSDFALVQSATGISSEEAWDKIEPCLKADNNLQLEKTGKTERLLDQWAAKGSVESTAS